MLSNTPAPTRRSRVHLSLRQRLMLAAALWLAPMIILAGLAIPLIIEDYLRADTKLALERGVDEIVANIEINNNQQLTLPYTLADARYNQPYSGYYWQLTYSGSVLRSRSLWDQAFGFDSLSGKLIGPRGEPLIVVERNITYPGVQGAITITLAANATPLRNLVEHITRQTWLILGVMFLGLFLVIGLQIGWSLIPLQRLQKELQQLKVGNIDALSNKYPKEIAPLVSDLNALIFHYQDLLSRARDHAGNLSHALKTPISILKNQIETLPDEEQAKLAVPLAQLQRHIDYHLNRARMAGSMNILAARTDVSECVDRISLAFDKIYNTRDVLLVNELESDVFVNVDASDLDEMIGNLLENAYKWADSMIRVYAIYPNATQIDIIIDDNGPGIPAEKRERACQRGVRLDETTPGSGLGLNIVSEMAHSYRGSLTLGANEPQGLRAVLSLMRSSY
uniref:ATP-binding protein n=1 Tax=Thaumasiovibrio occultus TaxID=1891184 RepID=UPI000B35F24A|nr:ATP-binding protein [Thaumasiovibrio occultus]